MSVKANYSEIDIGTIYGIPADRLKRDVAQDYGLLQHLALAIPVPKPNETVQMHVLYDWNSPKWPKKNTLDLFMLTV